MTKGEEAAEKAMAEYREAYEAANGKPAPMMRYTKGWIEFSCSPDRMLFPQRVRRAEIERRTEVLKFRTRRREASTA